MDPTISDETAIVPTASDAYAWCARLARRHYENFPVGSFLFPKRLRRHVFAIYAFARLADDIADAGECPATERLAALDDWEHQLRRAYNGVAIHPAFVALSATVAETALPIEPLAALLRAFRHDASGTGYATVNDLLAYCGSSAEPIGQMILHLHGLATPERIEASNRICTALQITNFLQDLSIDLPNGHNNIPRELLMPTAAGSEMPDTRGIGAALASLTAIANRLFEEGRPLLGTIGNVRLRLELELTWLGGMEILRRASVLGPELLRRRPQLSGADKLLLLLRAASRRRTWRQQS